MGAIAYIFPGQGSQAVGMGKDLYDNFAAARDVFKTADEALGFDLSGLCFAGDEADLQLTANTQPAILAASVAAYRAALSEGMPEPDVVAGHSLGEYSALVAAGALGLANAVQTVRKRGTYMQEAVPPGVGAMAAILGLEVDEVAAGCKEAAGTQVCSPANINSRTQVVIAGHAEAVDRACEILRSKGAKRAIKLNVSAPFHCSLMVTAQERLAAELAQLEYGDLGFPVVHNVDAERNVDAEKIPDRLTRQVSMPVQWLKTIENMRADGISTFIEIGPGKVLSGLVRQIDRDAVTSNIENSDSLRNTLDLLSK
jgi:[acyl-carrier-protein] S-malonyltransferase